GHQDAFAYGTSWYAEEGRSDVKDVCGDHPAIFGWELGHLELGDKYSLDSVFFDNIINHLLYGYSTDRYTSEAEYLERYPGDDLIDLIGFDLYDRDPEYAATLGSCAKMVTKIAAEKGKIVAVTEAGGPLTKTPNRYF
ncbi:MAG: glycosyl hydrolase, partial [Bacteroidota bacterium]|nr:glycosyl hydrolase [Bacteroidota bacterium]